MGTSSSRINFLDRNVFLQKFAGTQHISADNYFWNDMLNFSIKVATSVEEDKDIFDRAKPICNSLTLNNLKSGNFGSLLRVFLSKTSELLLSAHLENDSCSIQTCNALFIIRCYLQHLVQKYPESEVLKHIEAQGVAPSNKPEVSEPMLVQIVDSLIDILIHVPVKELTYSLHCETINTLLVLLSIQLFTTQTTNELELYRVVYENKQSESLCKTLLQRYIDQERLPADSSGSILLGLAAEFLSLFINSNDNQSIPLARKSVLLCVVLVNHCTGSSNVYRDCLSTISDGLKGLFNTICSTLDKEETTLILYHLLHRNNHFKAYILARSDIESLVVPMLQTIYHASDSTCHHMYMSLIILLILTEDSVFNKTVHNIILKNVPWYTDRPLPELSLGGLVILVTTRTVQYNLLKMRDEYLHTNCLAALANMSSQFTHLHPYVCQRLVGLFEILAKTYTRAKQELVAIERALRIILEVINSCLCNQLVHNTNLVYTLLYKKNIFDSFRTNPAFQDIINNLDQVLEYFSSKIENEMETCRDVNTVLNIVEKTAPQWPSHRLQKFPELKFKYVEEEKPEKFFIPYVWSLITKYSNIYWQPSQIKQC